MFRSSKPDPALQQRDAYIPPHVESAMANHVQDSMPAHLQKYRGGNAYIPEHAQAEMTKHLESTLPQHMKQYAGAYMQQNVVQPSLTRRSSTTPASPPPESSVTPHAPGVPTGLRTAETPPTTPAAPNQSPDQAYNFITSPSQPSKKSGASALLTTASMPIRVGIVAGGVLLLLILFVVLRGLLSSSPDLTSFVTVAQEQQELIHLVGGSSSQSGLSLGNKNVSATMDASLTSSQQQTITYLQTNKKKIKPEQLNLKVSAATDKQLSDAASAGTYNQVFREVLQSKLNAYASTLKQAYNQKPGPKGQALLSDSYRQAQLFQTQMDESPAQ